MEPRQIIRSGIAASAIVHLSFLLLLVFFAEVHPFSAVAPDSVAVDLVTPEEVKAKPPEEPPSEKSRSSDAFDLSAKTAPAPASSPQVTTSPPAAAPQPAATEQKQAAIPQPPTARTPDRRQPAAQQAQTPSPSPPAATAYLPPQPDVSVKYHVLLGLPQDRPGDGFDAAASEKADVGSSPIAEFRRHLKTCATLPKEVAPSDKVAVKLRVAMTPDGRLAAAPLLIEASASMKGALLMQNAITALQACQPYAMLPADKYNEWKILDLSFTPQDFGAS